MVETVETETQNNSSPKQPRDVLLFPIKDQARSAKFRGGQAPSDSCLLSMWCYSLHMAGGGKGRGLSMFPSLMCSSTIHIPSIQLLHFHSYPIGQYMAI